MSGDPNPAAPEGATETPSDAQGGGETEQQQAAPPPADKPAPAQSYRAREITGLDLARRQLIAAIRLFFEDRDPLIVAALGHSAWMICDEYGNRHGRRNFMEHIEEIYPQFDAQGHAVLSERHDRFFGRGRAIAHAHISTEGFDDSQNDLMLYIATEELMRVSGKSPIEAQILQLWYFALHFDGLSKPAKLRFEGAVKGVFPGLTELSRAEQKKKAMQMMKIMMKDQRLLASHKTDASEIEYWRDEE